MKNKKILIIDDETDVLEFLQIFLESNGYEVTLSNKCQEALALVKSQDFFLVLTDIAMPGMDGYEILEEIMKLKPGTSIAVMTGFGYNPKHTLVRIKEDHNCPCLFKPFNQKKVIDVVKRAFERFNQDPEIAI
jgi:DNA-binding NtrC family response regulator